MRESDGGEDGDGPSVDDLEVMDDADAGAGGFKAWDGHKLQPRGLGASQS